MRPSVHNSDGTLAETKQKQGQQQFYKNNFKFKGRNKNRNRKNLFGTRNRNPGKMARFRNTAIYGTEGINRICLKGQ